MELKCFPDLSLSFWLPLSLRVSGFLYPLTEIAPRMLALASGICFDRVLPKRVSCNPKSYLVQLGHWTVSRNFSENTSTFLPVGTGTEDLLGTKTSLMGETGEGLEELPSFWLVLETNFLPLVRLRTLKLKANPLLPRSLPLRLGKGFPQISRLLDAIPLNTSVDLVLVFELLQISSSNLLPNRSLDLLSASANSQSFNIVLAILLSDERDSEIKCLL